MAGGPAVLIETCRLDNLLQQPDLIVVVKNRETGFQADEFCVAAQDLDADRMECAEPRHAFERAADQTAYAVAHFAGGFVRERDGQDL